MPRIDTNAAGGVRDLALRDRSFTAVTAVACLVFVAYAGSFLFFFVDDEAIPLVYARSLLRGHGFVYTVLEGRVEGYSDFLHVLWSTLVMGVGSGLRQSHVFPLIAGKVVSFCAGIAILVVTAGALRRRGVTLPGLVAALGFLALAGPLAVWSCSSLDTAMFALLVTGFGVSLLDEGLEPGRGRFMSAALGIAIVLERIDGPYFVFAMLFAAWAAAPRRQRAVAAVAWPIGLVAIAYHGWRYAYFGSLLSAPLMAKVLYRVAGHSHIIAKAAKGSYLAGFLHLYGMAAAPALVVAALYAARDSAGRMAALVLVLLGIYVGVVEDWMFGWRFVVALLPFVALILGVSIGRAPRAVGWSAAAVVLLWSGLAARHFVSAYIDGEQRPIFWTHVHGGEPAWLAPYYGLYVTARPLIHPGDRIAYNQAGLLPYLLDAENIDDLGICSRFVAGLPTTDVYFTAVGRYSQLTNHPVLETAHAYLLYRDVQFLIGRTDLLWKADNASVPDLLLDGLYARVAVDPGEINAVYRRTAKPADAYRRDPSLFTENLIHTTRLTRASIDGAALPPDEFGPALPFLRTQTLSRRISRNFEVDLGFGKGDEDVDAFYIQSISSTHPATLTIVLADGTGRETLKRTFPIADGGGPVFERFDTPVRARAISIRVEAAGDSRLSVSDMRLAGQSAALGAYVHRMLRFPES